MVEDCFACFELALDEKAGQRVGWSDRHGGWFDWFPHVPWQGEGYHGPEGCRIREMFPVRNGRILARSALHARIRFGDVLLADGEGLSIRCGPLLAGEGFWYELTLGTSPDDADAVLSADAAGSADPSLGMVLALPRGLVWMSGTAGSQTERKSADADSIFVRSGCYPLPHGELWHVAVAANVPFEVLDTTRTLPENPAQEAIPETASLHLLSFGAAPSIRCCIAWGPSADDAASSAATLVRTDAPSRHRAAIEQECFRLLPCRSGYRDLDAALAWAMFSGWTLVQEEKQIPASPPALWAGLPWFREQWGRDTFIALPGILLATGQHAVAKAIFRSFAQRQDRNHDSPTQGRIPNRWRTDRDIIYNTVDGTLWFIRELWEYFLYTADTDLVLELRDTVFAALDADLQRCDRWGFLCHDDADTWMDARIEGRAPWSPRGNRAVEVQALFYTALLVGVKIAELAGDAGRALRYGEEASRLRQAFRTWFWDQEAGRLADRLLPAPPDQGELSVPQQDRSARPNALIALSAASLFEDEAPLLPPELAAQAIADSWRELAFPWGIATLSQEDPRFHPHHDGSPLWPKDAAYHNGTVWGWLAGPALSCLLRWCDAPTAYRLAGALLHELARQILRGPTPGTMSECVHAHPDAEGHVTASGTWSQAWNVAAFVQIMLQDWLGIRMDAQHRILTFAPRGVRPGKSMTARAPLPHGDILTITACQKETSVRVSCSLHRRPDRNADHASDPLAGWMLSVRWFWKDQIYQAVLPLKDGSEISLRLGPASDGSSLPLQSGGMTVVHAQQHPLPHASRFSCLRFVTPRLREWNGPAHQSDFLHAMIRQGAYDDSVPLLAWWYDSPGFARRYHFRGWLGVSCSEQQTEFRLWSPCAAEVQLLLWREGEGGTPAALYPMRRGPRGTWYLSIPACLHGWYYTYALRVFGISRVTIDPYALSAGINGKRGMILDPARCEPEGWNTQPPPPNPIPSRAIVYEVHIRDITSRESWQGPASLRGTWVGASLSGTCLHTKEGSFPTGFDYLASLGVTHLQVLPQADFVSVDESKVHDPEYLGRPQGGIFNWGYDPGNWGAPEGSYSTDPEDGIRRVRELRQFILACHRAGMGVILDSVYNHVPDRRSHSLELCVPGYYFRGRGDSGAGDDTASERYMFRQYMASMLEHWLTTYRIEGFRFDLMGLHDVATMRSVARRLRAIRPDVLLYGEGWVMCGKEGLRCADQTSIRLLPDLGMFHDAFRDAIRGSVFDTAPGGWLYDGSRVESLKFGIVGAVAHPQVRNERVVGTANPEPWGPTSDRCINYIEIHDNLTLHDRLVLIKPDASTAWLARLQRLALTVLLSTQGMIVLHAGCEFLRTKEVPAQWRGLLDRCVRLTGTDREFCYDSYKAGDLVNGLDWERMIMHRQTVEYVRGLIALRKALPHFNLRKGSAIRKHLRFLADQGGVLIWQLTSPDDRQGILIAANANEAAITCDLPCRLTNILADSGEAWVSSTGRPCTESCLVLEAASAAIFRTAP